jgi:RNA-binding protein YlmH
MKKKPTQRINETESWSFEKINNIDKPFFNLIKMRGEKTQINKIRDEEGDITTNTNEIQRIMREYFEKLYSNKLENLEEMEKFLDTFDLPNLNQEDIHHLNRTITSDENGAIVKSLHRIVW